MKYSENPIEKESQQNKKTTFGFGYWYYHNQRLFLPYTTQINHLIESAFFQHYEGDGNCCSPDFEIHSRAYHINFVNMLQICSINPSRYRTVRRIGLKKRLPLDGDINHVIPLSYTDILRSGGHPQHYLCENELAARKVQGEDEENFFPAMLREHGIVMDTFGGD